MYVQNILIWRREDSFRVQSQGQLHSTTHCPLFRMFNVEIRSQLFLLDPSNTCLAPIVLNKTVHSSVRDYDPFDGCIAHCPLRMRGGSRGLHGHGIIRPLPSLPALLWRHSTPLNLPNDNTLRKSCISTYQPPSEATRGSKTTLDFAPYRQR